LLEDNSAYRKIEQPFFSEYGVNNAFHPTMNFFVPPNFIDDDTGTVFSNLDSPINAIAHHTMGVHLPSFKLSNPLVPSVLHLRKSDGVENSLARYVTFLDGSKRNRWSSSNGTIGEALACVQEKPKWIIEKKRLCWNVKEISNILGPLIQRNKCLDEGNDKLTCDNELPCCATIVAG